MSDLALDIHWAMLTDQGFEQVETMEVGIGPFLAENDAPVLDNDGNKVDLSNANAFVDVFENDDWAAVLTRPFLTSMVSSVVRKGAMAITRPCFFWSGKKEEFNGQQILFVADALATTIMEGEVDVRHLHPSVILSGEVYFGLLIEGMNHLTETTYLRVLPTDNQRSVSKLNKMLRRAYKKLNAYDFFPAEAVKEIREEYGGAA